MLGISERQVGELVDRFYGRVRQDALLGPIFEAAIGDEWEPHLATMRAFWSSVMLGAGQYKGNPLMKHLMLPRLEPEMFARWLALWRETAAEVMDPQTAAMFVTRAEGIARHFLASIASFHDAQPVAD